jgi:hypothetical protein
VLAEVCVPLRASVAVVDCPPASVTVEGATTACTLAGRFVTENATVPLKVALAARLRTVVAMFPELRVTAEGLLVRVIAGGSAVTVTATAATCTLGLKFASPE